MQFTVPLSSTHWKQSTVFDSNNEHGIGIIRNFGLGNNLKENSVGKYEY